MAYDVREAPTWPVNELGEIIFSVGQGTSSIKGQLPSSLIPVADNGQVKAVFQNQVGLKPYFGQVASHCGVNTAKFANYNQCMCRVAVRATEDLTSFSVVFPTWGTVASGDVDIDAPSTLELSVEYPVDVYTRVKFNGVNIGTASGGANFVSDFVNVSIPKGAVFWLRPYLSAPGTTGIYATSSAFSPQGPATVGSVFEGGIFSQTLSATNLVMTKGTGGSSGNNDGFNTPVPIYRPVAIIALTTRPSVFFAGDSIIYGQFDVSDTMLANGTFERVFKCGTINAGCPGESVTNLTASNYRRRSALAQYCSHVVTEYGHNDIYALSKTAAQVTAGVISLYNTWFKDKPFIPCTLTPQTTSSDSFATDANQTIDGKEAVRTVYNDTVRSGGITGYYAYIDLSDIFESPVSPGKWRTYGTSANALTGDGTHPNKNGCIYGSSKLNTSFLL